MAYDKALAVKPDIVEALSNRGIVLADLNRFEEAVESYDRALAIKPDYAEALNNRAAALMELGRLDEALANYSRAVAIKPDYIDAKVNRHFVDLLKGDLVAGWIGYDRRWDRVAPRSLS